MSVNHCRPSKNILSQITPENKVRMVRQTSFFLFKTSSGRFLSDKEFTCTLTVLSGTCIEHTPKKKREYPNGIKSFVFKETRFEFPIG